AARRTGQIRHGRSPGHSLRLAPSRRPRTRTRSGQEARRPDLLPDLRQLVAVRLRRDAEVVEVGVDALPEQPLRGRDGDALGTGLGVPRLAPLVRECVEEAERAVADRERIETRRELYNRTRQ